MSGETASPHSRIFRIVAWNECSGHFTARSQIPEIRNETVILTLRNETPGAGWPGQDHAKLLEKRIGERIARTVLPYARA